MKIIQISDIHLSDNGEMPFNLNNYNRLESVIEDAISYLPDLWVFTGDICLNEPHETGYEFLAMMIEDYDLQFQVISGNHDKTELLSDIIYHNSVSRYFHHEHYPHFDILYLDTHDASLSIEEISLIRNLPFQQTPLIIFMHYPPILCGVPHMDENYPFGTLHMRERFIQLIEAAGRPTYIFTGHYHNPRSISKNNWQIHISPAIHVHMDDRTPHFEILHNFPGYRIIEITSSGVVSTWNRYLYDR